MTNARRLSLLNKSSRLFEKNAGRAREKKAVGRVRSTEYERLIGAHMTDFSFAATENLDDLGSTVTKYEQNVSALRLLKELEAEGRAEATLHEQMILARYTGWGDSALLKRAFPNGVSPYLPPSEELKELLTGEELKALRASSLNAHYTSLPVIRAIYAGLRHAGLHHLPATRGAFAASSREVERACS